MTDELKTFIRGLPDDTPVEYVLKNRMWFKLWEMARQEGALSLLNGIENVEFVYAHRTPSYNTLGDLRFGKRQLVRSRDLSIQGYDVIVNIFEVPPVLDEDERD